ncbi:MAG: GYF domain-containing protein [Prevotella sp.]|nr:GYF domain-containing protein [Bacteroides sp.]MCM1366467.1 GYF domain-containing protein [Prevotella sp.]MCM1437053.1 GYF domain-containing protein [Prevotella sp.]
MSGKFFAIIDGEKAGPYTLTELEEAGVGPDTYVWCKGMTKWRMARSVADVCRYWRQRLGGEIPTKTDVEERNGGKGVDDDNNINTEVVSRRGALRTIRSFNPEEGEPDVDKTLPPANLVPISLLIIFLCMPLTGFAALYFAVRAKTLWMQREKIEKNNTKEAEEYADAAHDAVRSSKMWIGISFFLGIIVWAVMMYFMPGGN